MTTIITDPHSKKEIMKLLVKYTCNSTLPFETKFNNVLDDLRKLILENDDAFIRRNVSNESLSSINSVESTNSVKSINSVESTNSFDDSILLHA